jgi:signal transduction histidine kinase
MALSPQNAAIVLLSRTNGTLIEVLYDELGVSSRIGPGTDFTELVIPSSRRKAARFLRTVQGSHSALDWELSVKLQHAVPSFFFSGCLTDDGMVIVGTKDAISDVPISADLVAAAGESAGGLKQAFTEFGARRDAMVAKERSLNFRLSQLEQAMAHSQAEHGEAGLARRATGSKQIRVLEMAAHDLQNPISGVLAATQFLIEDAADRLDPRQVSLLHSIGSSSRTMLRVLDDMLEIPTIDAALPHMDFQPTDLRTLVEQSVSMVRPVAEQRRVQVELTAGDGIPPLSADPVRMSQVLQDLLAAAVKWSRPGGRVALTVTARWNHAVITIANDGPDSSAEAVKYLLGPHDLRRLKGGLAEARAALTLGRVKRIIEAHRGTTQAESSQDQGFALTLTLPIARRAKSAAVAESKKRSTQGR